MTLSQKRRRRVELLIDQRLVGFLKPVMTVTHNPMNVTRKPPQPAPAEREPSMIEPEERAS